MLWRWGVVALLNLSWFGLAPLLGPKPEPAAPPKPAPKPAPPKHRLRERLRRDCRVARAAVASGCASAKEAFEKVPLERRLQAAGGVLVLAVAQRVLTRRSAAGPSAPRRASVVREAEELLALLNLPERSEAEGKRLLILAQELATRPRRTVALEGAGEWKVAWSEKPLHYRWLPFAGAEAQTFDTVSGQLSSELSYGPVKIKAGGEMSPEGGPSPTYRAKMGKGELTVGPLKLPLLVFGQNKLELRYGDARLRVFQGEGGLAVQTRK